MKRLLLAVFLLFTCLGNAQIIDFPDPVFKAVLVNHTDPIIDANSDGEISVAEALVVTNLDIPSGDIASLAGLENFVNLLDFKIFDNDAITDIDLSFMTAVNSIEILDLGLLSNLNLNALTNVSAQFYCLTNASLTNLTLPSLTQIDGQMRIGGPASLAINIPLLENANNIWTEGEVISLQLPSLISADEIFLEGGQLADVDLTSLQTVGVLDIIGHWLTELDLNSLKSATNINASFNLLTSIDISNVESVDQYIDVYGNELTSLDISSLSGHLLGLFIGENIMSELIFTNEWDSVDDIDAFATGFTELDFSTVLIFDSIDVTDCPLLETLYLKNSSDETVSLAGADALTYICVDDSQIEAVSASVVAGGIPNAVVGSYCSFTPGGVFYTVEGDVQFDFMSDGCDEFDAVAAYTEFLIEEAGEPDKHVFANSLGHYQIFLKEGTYIITPQVEYEPLFFILPTSISITIPDDIPDPDIAYVQDFCLSPNGLHPDVAVTILPLEPARPGFDAAYRIVYRNYGNAIQSGEVLFSYDDAVLDFIASSDVPIDASEGAVTFEYIDLEPFEIRSIDVTLNVNAPTDTPPVNNGDLLSYTAQIDPIDTDENPEDNIFILDQIVVGSYDPNDKTCLQGETITPEMVGEYVDYLIRFENTGTFAAENIVVKDTLNPAFYNIQSFKAQYGSHDFVTRVTDNVVEFIFEGINLPFDDENNDGYVLFKIKTLETLKVGDSFSNNAGIYFDYNFPIITNDAITTIEKILGIEEFANDAELVLYPNPASDLLTIELKDLHEISSVTIFSINGQQLMTFINPSETIDVSRLQAGVYVVEIRSSEGLYYKRLIKK